MDITNQTNQLALTFTQSADLLNLIVLIGILTIVLSIIFRVFINIKGNFEDDYIENEYKDEYDEDKEDNNNKVKLQERKDKPLFS
jgi:hypothetical protein